MRGNGGARKGVALRRHANVDRQNVVMLDQGCLANQPRLTPALSIFSENGEGAAGHLHPEGAEPGRRPSKRVEAMPAPPPGGIPNVSPVIARRVREASRRGNLRVHPQERAHSRECHADSGDHT